MEETARYTEEKLEPDADRLAELDERLCELLQHLDERPKVRVTYFVKDEKKTGGRYVTQSFVIRKVDTYAKILVTEEKNIPLQDIFLAGTGITVKVVFRRPAPQNIAARGAFLHDFGAKRG